MIFLSDGPKIEGLTVCDWNEQGNSLFHLGHCDDALKAFDRAIELDPKNSRAWECKGMVLDYMGRMDDALKAVDRAIKFDPKNSGLWLKRGDILIHKCQKDNAIVAYNRAIELDPNNSWAKDALKNLVNIKANKGFSNPPDKKKDSINNEFMSANRREELKKDGIRHKGNAKDYFIMILVGAIICALIAQSYMRNLVGSIFIFFVVFVILIFAQISSTCSNCGNVNGISLDNEKLVDTKQYQKHFTKQEIVATSKRKIVITSERDDRDVNVMDIIKHYENVNYLKTTTIKTYEKIYVCKYCGATFKKQYQTKSSEINRL